MAGRRQTPLAPKPPQWALDAGLPAPLEGEDYTAYVTRLGYDATELLVDLTPRTMALAHVRLADRLARSLPDAWAQHLDEFVRPHIRQPKPTL